MFERVKPGDILLCYCKAPASRWIGALRVTGEVFQSGEPIWGLTEEGDVRFPWRYPVEPVVALDPVRAVPGDEVAPQLTFLNRLKQWGTFLQRSLNRVPDRDGVRLIELLREPRDPLPIHAPKHRARRHPRAGPEPTLLDSRALTLERQTPLDAPAAEPESEPRTHTEIQAKLRDIGLFEGFDVWVADRGIMWNGRPLGEGCLARLPVVAPERTRAVMKLIDAIWFRKGAGHPVRFFEIEHSTTVYSGLLRFNDVMIDFPIPEAFIVGDGEKTRAKFERELARRTFEHSGLGDVTKYLFYAVVRETSSRYQGVGLGSSGWGQDAADDPARSA
jgi:hypothetical protein